MELTDAAIVSRARAGDTDAFRELVERHSRSLFRLAFRMTGNQQDAEDVVQESFLRAYRQLASFDDRASFGTWMYRIASNCSLDLVRARKRRNDRTVPTDDDRAEDPMAQLPSSDPTPERIALSGEVRQRVADAMGEPDDGSGDGSRAVRAVRRILAELDFPVLASLGFVDADLEHLAELALADYFITMSPAPWAKDEVVGAFRSALAVGSRTV